MAYGNTRSLTSQGHAQTRLRDALDRGNLVEAMASASQLEHVGLVEALELVLLLSRDGDSPRYRRAALRWATRYGESTRTAEPVEVEAVLCLLLMLTGEKRAQAAEALAYLLDRRRDLLAGSEALAAGDGRRHGKLAARPVPAGRG